MSAITSRPSVRGLRITAVHGAPITGAACANALLASSSEAAHAAWHALLTTSASDPAEIRAPGALFPTFAADLPGLRHLSPVEAIRVETALSLAHYIVGDPQALAAPSGALASATTPAEAYDARHALLSVAATLHHEAFTSRLVAACTRASVAAGFPVVETTTRGDMVRLVATNAAGHALVTEVRAPTQGEPSLATELVGLHDGTCHAHLDRFDAALEAEGVRATAAQRRFTGGVAELAAARAFARQKLQPKRITTAPEPTATTAPVPRRRSGTVQRQQQR